MSSLPGTGLGVCASCRSDSVHAAARRRESATHWRLLLRCGACEACREVVVPLDLAARFEQDEARGRELIAWAMARGWSR